MSQCNFPFISKLKGIYVEQPLTICIIEELYYEDLSSIIFKKKIKIPDKKNTVLQILQALKFIHEKRFVHCDLKLKNIVFRDSTLKYIVLLDFGSTKLMKKVNDKTYCNTNQTNVQKYTRGYMAPECLQGANSKVAFNSDIFAFGLILYSIVSELPCWNKCDAGEENIQINDKIKNGTYNFFEDNCPTKNASINKVIEKCVSFDRKCRPTVQQLIETLSALNF